MRPLPNPPQPHTHTRTQHPLILPLSRRALLRARPRAINHNITQEKITARQSPVISWPCALCRPSGEGGPFILGDPLCSLYPRIGCVQAPGEDKIEVADILSMDDKVWVKVKYNPRTSPCILLLIVPIPRLVLLCFSFSFSLSISLSHDTDFPSFSSSSSSFPSLSLLLFLPFSQYLYFSSSPIVLYLFLYF